MAVTQSEPLTLPVQTGRSHTCQPFGDSHFSLPSAGYLPSDALQGQITVFHIRFCRKGAIKSATSFSLPVHMGGGAQTP